MLFYFLQKNKRCFIYFFSIFMSIFAYASSNQAQHFKQMSDDGHTFILYSLKCSSLEKKNCSLKALAVSDEKAKNSCFVVYKTLFENMPLHNFEKTSYSIETERKKCGDSVKFVFSAQGLKTSYTEKKLNSSVSVSDDRCEIFKATKHAGEFISEEPLLPQVAVGGCKTLTFRMDD